MNLRKKIHQELISENENREQSMLLESKIIRSHFSKIKNCDSMDCITETLIEKITLFKNKNFSPKLIRENVFDIMTSLFGELDESFYEEAKRRTIDTAFKDLPLEDEYKECMKSKILSNTELDPIKLIEDTDYLSDKVSLAYIECFQEKTIGSFKPTSGSMSQELYNGIQSLTNDSGLLARISNKASKPIDSSLSNVRKKQEEIADKLRNIVLGK